MVLANIWMTIQKYYLNIVYYYRIQIIIVGSPDIELLYCIKDIDLYIYWSLIYIREKSTSEMIKLSLNFKIVEVWLPNDWVVNFDFYWSHSKCYIILSYIIAKFSWGIPISSQVVVKDSSEWLERRQLDLSLQIAYAKFGMINLWGSKLLTVRVKSMTVRANNNQHTQVVILYISF